MIKNSVSSDFEKKLKTISDDLGYFKDLNLLPLLRRTMKFRHISKHDKGFVSTNHSKRNVFEIFTILRSVLLSILSLRFLFNNSLVKSVFLGFSRRSHRLDGKLEDRFHDPIIDILESTQCLMIERPFKLGHSNNRATKCKVIDYDLFVYTSIFLTYILFPVVLFRNKELIKNYVNSINNEFGYSIVGSKELARIYCSFKVESFFARIFLRLIKPHHLVITSRWLHYPMLYQANILNIKVFEIQHGCVMPDNFFYCETNEKQFEVDAMLVFSDYWKQSNWNTKNVISFGINKDGNQLNCERKQSAILVISQPESSAKLNHYLFEIASANPNVMFEIKLHPQDIANYTKRYADVLSLDNVIVVDRPDLKTDTLTTMYYLVLGFTSSVLFEAYHLGASVGIMCKGEEDVLSYNKYYGEAMSCFHLLPVGEEILPKYFEHKESNMKFYDELNKDLITELLK